MSRIAIMGTGAQAGYALDILHNQTDEHIILVELLDEARVGHNSYGFPIAVLFTTFLRGFAPDEFRVLVGIGNPSVKKQTVNSLKSKGFNDFAKAISAQANVSRAAEVKSGSIICQGANIMLDAYIAQHCIVHAGAVVEHDCWLGNYVNIGPGAVLAGRARIAEGAQIGANATVLPGIIVGLNSIVGAGSVVTKNVPNNVTVYGNPARIPSVVDWR